MKNWKIISTKTGKLSYAACIGDKMLREFDDIAYALIFEGRNEFKNSLNDFLAESKRSIEAQMQGKHFERKIERIDSTAFRALQRKLEKAEEKERLKQNKA